MESRFFVVFTVFFAAIVVIGMITHSFPVQSNEYSKKISERNTSLYETAITNYIYAVEIFWEKSHSCRDIGMYKNFSIATINFQTAIQNGNLEKVEQTSQELTALSYSVEYSAEGQSDLSVSRAQKDLSREIGNLRSFNITSFPIDYRYPLFDTYGKCSYRYGGTSSDGGSSASE